MRYLLIISTLPIIIAFTHSQKQNNQIFTIDNNSWLQITGKSNVNSFDCTIKEQLCGKEILACYNIENNNIIFSSTAFNIPVIHFDCNNKMMTKDLQKSLKYDEFPTIEFQLISTSLTRDKSCAQYIAKTEVTIAGVTNSYDLQYEFTPIEGDRYNVELNQEFLMSDFNIEQPTALMGLITVEDKIMVHINLVISYN